MKLDISGIWQKKIRKMMVVFRNKEYHSRNVNEGPTHKKGSESSARKHASSPFVGFLKIVIIFCTTNKAFKNRIKL